MMNLLVEPQRSYNRLWARHNLFYLSQFRRINHRYTRLNRFVAIKVLPEHLSQSAELKARFEREAQTLRNCMCVEATKNTAHRLARIFYYGLLTWYT